MSILVLNPLISKALLSIKEQKMILFKLKLYSDYQILGTHVHSNLYHKKILCWYRIFNLR